MNNNEKEYLGDSVYIEDTGHEIVLTTENGLPSGPSNVIYLDFSVCRILLEYLRKKFAV